MPRHPDLPCADCGQMMWRSSLPAGQARCRPCRRAANPPKPKPSQIQTWTCEACGVECSRVRVRGQVPRWCADCRVRGCKWQSRNCLRCSTAFLPTWAPQVYCGRACRYEPKSKELVGPVPQFCPLPKAMRPHKARTWVMGWCQRCDTTFVIRDQLTNRYCSVRCAKSDGRERRDAVKRNAFVENVYRARIYERDQWRCQLCCKKVNRKAVVPHPKAPTLDHILPISLGGTHEPANVQLACFMCNAIKSHGLYLGQPEQLRLLGS